MLHLTGRIEKEPNEFIDEKILTPQFNFELEHLLNHYIRIEKVLAKEYERLQIISNVENEKISISLNKISANKIMSNAKKNMSDISFAIERFVEEDLRSVPPGWHTDRSRNDVQSCAQIMFVREQVILLSNELHQLCKSLLLRADETLNKPFPGRTHYQPAQIITPGFYFLSIVEELLQAGDVLLYTFDRINQCPLGAGAMSGLEFNWDRTKMAKALGFNKPKDMALTSVASRQWILEVASIQSNLGVLISRLVTDIIGWCVSKYVDLPDDLAGISSAMPQKKNYPILERIRGQTSHMSSFYNDLIISQKNTPFSNLVETSKEGCKYVLELFSTSNMNLKLLKMTIDNLIFNEKQMREDCEKDFYGGFSLANYLTSEFKIPNRKSQAITGNIIRIAIERNLTPQNINSSLIIEECSKHGYEVFLNNQLIRRLFSTHYNLNKKTTGSTSPDSVKVKISEYRKRLNQSEKEWDVRVRKVLGNY
ncbi:argininosuccinate lyase [Peribacillus simplex]|uniref:argininosuccinate lyase n=1 Tax=Peribacillus simplex TaxID=1478 RepID=UPI003D2ADE3D